MNIRNRLFLLCFIILVFSLFIGSPIVSVAANRISGEDRYGTAVKISNLGWSSGSTENAVLVTGEDFPDALCAVPLAQKYNAPILLTNKSVLDERVDAELKRLGVKNVYIIGGTGVISSGIEGQIEAKGINCIRIAGKDRYETAIKIAKLLDTNKNVIIATGNDYPDALSIASIAAKLGIPILLTQKGELPQIVKEYINEKQISKSYIVGGTGVISDTVKDATPNPIRLSGNNRYETNVAIMQEFASILNFNDLYIAIGEGPNGDEFADALSGAALASKKSSPVILAYKELSKAIGDFIKLKASTSSTIVALGGSAVVPEKVLNDIYRYIYEAKLSKRYDKAGIYGPTQGIDTISGNVAISSANIILQNTTIDGDLILTEDIGNGNVELRNVTVKGTTLVRGGGPNSVVMYNFNGEKVIVNVPDGGNVRLVAKGDTNVKSLVMSSNGKLEESSLDGNGFTVVDIPAGVQIVLMGDFDIVNVEANGTSLDIKSGEINNLNILENADNSNINLSNGVVVNNLKVDTSSSVSGQGRVENAAINSQGVIIEQKPNQIIVKEGITASVGGQQQTGNSIPVSGGGGGVPVATITDIDDITANVNQNDSYTLPTTVTAKMSDNTTKTLSIVWDPAVVDTSIVGILNFEGTVEGYRKKVILTLTVMGIEDNTHIEVGNTIENIANGGIVAQKGEWVYYKNNFDNGSIYKVKTDNTARVKLNNHDSDSINVVDNWIYYRFYDGLYRMRTDGTSNTRLVYGGVCNIHVVGDWIYYSTNTVAGNFYKMKIDGTENTRISDDYVQLFSIVGDWIYYNSNSDNKLYKMRSDGSGKIKLTDDLVRCFAVDGEWIYYNNDSFYKMKIDGTSKTKISSENLYYFNITDNCVFYSNGDGILYKFNVDGTGKTEIISANTHMLCISDNWIYYLDFMDNKLYRVRTDGSNNQQFRDESVISNIGDIYVSVQIGESYTPPERVIATMSDCSIKEVEVSWVTTPTIVDISQEGIYTYEGDVQGYSRQVALEVTVVAQKNLETGNTNGNVVNSGNAAQKGDWIYYRNGSDGDKLYKVKNDGSEKTKLDDDRAININVVDDWVYYSNYSDYYGIYKIKTDGTERTKLSEDMTTELSVVGDWIYYNNDWQKGCRLYKIRTDGTDRTQLNEDYSGYINVSGDWIYYTNIYNGYKVYKVKTDGTKKTDLGFNGFSTIVENDWIFYHFQGQLYKAKTDGSGKTKLTNSVYFDMSYINLNEGWIYFVNSLDGNKLYKVAINGEDQMKVIDDIFGREYSETGIVNDWIYYYSRSDNNRLYRIKKDGSQKQLVD